VKVQATTQSWSRSRVLFYTVTPILMALAAWVLAAAVFGLFAGLVGRFMHTG
jgi:hypothetical protein